MLCVCYVLDLHSACAHVNFIEWPSRSFFCIARLVVYSRMEASLDDRTVCIGNIPDFMDDVAIANYLRGLGLPQALSIILRPRPKNEQCGLFQYASKTVVMEMLDSKIVWANDRNALIRPSHFKPDARISPHGCCPSGCR